MGITRIVEGDLINTSTSMNLSANDGNYEFHAAGKNKWQGDENGIIEGNYEPPSKENSLSNSINVRLNLFFDGTTNNKTNTEARNESSKNHETYIKEGNKNDDSFENDYTNVARGFDAVDPSAENQVAVYIEGIGTEDLKSDSVANGVMRGEGDTGVKAKVTKGCMDAAVEMSTKGYNGKDIDILYVNVYGFSRGATAARHFIHVASKNVKYENKGEVKGGKRKYGIVPEYNFLYFSKNPYWFDIELIDSVFIDKYGYFGACLLYQGMKIKEIRFNFVGIYDTVASYGLDHRGGLLIDNDTKQLNLDAISKARYVFHLASDDEYRDNFDLTNINSAGISGLELTLPGVHSDIGGSYLNNVLETSVIDNHECGIDEEVKDYTKKRYEKDYDAFRKIVEEEGWYVNGQLTKEFFYEKDLDKFSSWYSNAYQYNYGLIGRRKLFNTYDKISLKLMVESSKAHGDVVYLKKQEEKNQIKDNFINSFYNQLLGYINACINIRNLFVKEYNNNISQANFDALSKQYLSEIKKEHYSRYVELEDLKTLRNQYLHWSAKDNRIGLEPIKTGALPQNERKRNIQDG